MRSLLAIALLGWMSATAAQTAPPLGAAASFAVLAGSSVRSNGARIGGNVGVSPGETISGSMTFVVGRSFGNDVSTRTAQHDAAAAYQKLLALSCAPLTSSRPPPGVHCLNAPLSGTLILDARGVDGAVWVFRGNLTTAPGTTVLLLNGASRDNVFWQVPGSATLGADTKFAGNILAVDSITLGSGAHLTGRALAQQGAVTLGEAAFVSMCCPLVALSPQTLPPAIVGVPYNQPISPGPAVVTSGSLPPGLTPAISGTPTQPGKYVFTLTSTVAGCPGTTEYEINVTGCPTITIQPATLTPFVDGCAMRYREKLQAVGGTGPYTFSATMPAGMTLSGDTISGTPQECTTFEVIARDATTGCEGRRMYSVCPWPISIAPATEALPDGLLNLPYERTLIASGGVPPYTFAICAGRLPRDLTFSNGKIEGTPHELGVFPFTVTATDARGQQGSRTYTLRILDCPAITVSPTTVDNGVVGQEYKVQFMANGGKPDYVFTSTPVLPDLPLSGSGLLTGIPRTPGTLDFTVTATDAAGCSGMRSYRVTFALSCPEITIAPAALPEATACTPYSQQFSATPGGPYIFAATGSLPEGMSPLTPDGVLAGTPTQSGDFPITVTATDTVTTCSASRSYTLRVNGGGGSPITGVSTTLPSGTMNVFYSQLLPVVGGTMPFKFKVVTGSGTSVPPGLTVSQAGVLSGIPTQGGSYRFNVDVTSSGSCSPHRITYSVAIFPIP